MPQDLAVSLFTGLREILEALFTREWLEDARNQRHQACRAYHLCLRLEADGGRFRWPEHVYDFPLLGKAVLDATSFIAVSAGKLDSFTLGSLSSMGSASSVRKVTTRLRDEAQYQDLLTELHIGSWYLTTGHHVTLLEEPNLPDFDIELAGGAVHLWVECKRLHALHYDSVLRNLTKANQQLRNTREADFGYACLDISEHSSVLSASAESRPQSVDKAIAAVTDVLRRNSFRSIGAVLVVWMSYSFHRNDEGTSVMVVQKMHQVVRNGSGAHKLPESIPLFNGLWNAVGISTSSSMPPIDLLDTMIPDNRNVPIDEIRESVSKDLDTLCTLCESRLYDIGVLRSEAAGLYRLLIAGRLQTMWAAEDRRRPLLVSTVQMKDVVRGVGRADVAVALIGGGMSPSGASVQHLIAGNDPSKMPPQDVLGRVRAPTAVSLQEFLKGEAIIVAGRGVSRRYFIKYLCRRLGVINDGGEIDRTVDTNLDIASRDGMVVDVNIVYYAMRSISTALCLSADCTLLAADSQGG